MITGPVGNFNQHPKGCNCDEHNRDAELSRNGYKIARQMLEATKAGDDEKAARLCDELEGINHEAFRLRYGN